MKAFPHFKCQCSETWKNKYRIVEKMLVRKYSWSHGPEWAKRLIRQEVKDTLREKSGVRS